MQLQNKSSLIKLFWDKMIILTHMGKSNNNNIITLIIKALISLIMRLIYLIVEVCLNPRSSILQVDLTIKICLELMIHWLMVQELLGVIITLPYVEQLIWPNKKVSIRLVLNVEWLLLDIRRIFWVEDPLDREYQLELPILVMDFMTDRIFILKIFQILKIRVILLM